MKEIGGYIEIEHYRGEILHGEGILLNCGRNALRYLIRARGIKEILVPCYMCDSVFDGCREEGAEISFYHVGRDFLPADIKEGEERWIYLMNYYGQLGNDFIRSFCMSRPNVILDDVQAYFHTPGVPVDTIYSCRKFFGLADGGILAQGRELPGLDLQRDLSYDRMAFLMGRYEKSAGEFYGDYTKNNDHVGRAPVMYMSYLTENFLRSIDYDFVRTRREENYQVLKRELDEFNQISAGDVTGPFAYPFMTEGGSLLRKKLIQNKIFVPLLWPNVLEQTEEGSSEYRMASDLLPLPCDQRYGEEDMLYMAGLVKTLMKEL